MIHSALTLAGLPATIAYMNFSMDSLLPMSFAIGGVSIFWIVTAITHISFACGVFVDVGYLRRYERRGTFLVGRFIWTLATLIGGVYVAAIYWLIHHSSLRPKALDSGSER